MYGPMTVTDLLKMMWWTLTNPAPKSTLGDSKAAADRALEDPPLLVVSGPDHSYRQARPVPTTAILCVEKGRRSLHEDHFPDEPPGKGFDDPEKLKLTRVKVLLVQ